MKKQVTCLFVFIALLIVLPAFSGGQEEGSLEERPVTLKHWTFMDPMADNVRAKAHHYVHETFMKKYPNIKLEVDVINWKEFDSLLIRSVEAKQPPDVGIFYSPSLMFLVNAGAIQPLDGFVSEWTKEQREDFIAWDATTVNGQKYAFPYEYRITGMIYRKDLLDAAGFEYPKSLQELGAQAGKLTNPPDMIGFVNPANTESPIAAMEIMLPIAYGEGGQLLGKDGRAAINTPEWVKTVDYWKQMVYEYKAMPLDMALMDNEGANALLYAGKGVFQIVPSHRVGYIRDRSGPDMQWEYGPIPSFRPNISSPAAIFSRAFVIPTNSEHPEEAFKFIEYFTSAEIQAYLAERPKYMPVRKSAFEYPWFKTPEASDVHKFSKIVEENPLTVVLPEDTTELFTYITEAIEKVLSNPEIDTLTALNEAAAKYNK